jgi:hypothetical protein
MTLAMAKPALQGMNTLLSKYTAGSEFPLAKPDPYPMDVDNPPKPVIYAPGSLLGATGEDTANAEFNLKGKDPIGWSITYNKDFIPEPDDDQYEGYPTRGNWTTLWNQFTGLADGFNESIEKFIWAQEKFDEAVKYKEEIERKFTAPCLKDDDGNVIEGEFDCVKKTMDEIFGSKFLLPGTWAALL